MSQQGFSSHRAQLAAEANLRAQAPPGALTFLWRSDGRVRSSSLPYWGVGLGCVAVFALAIWGVAVTSYLVFKDDILTTVVARQTAVEDHYEERIRALRGEVDRLTSRAMVDQSDIERRVDQIARRQQVLETRHSIISGLADAAGQRVLQGGTGTAAPISAPQPAPRPQPVGDTLIVVPPAHERHSRLESRVPVRDHASTGAEDAADAKAAVIARIENSLASIETRQAIALDALDTRTTRQSRRIRSVIADLGLDQHRMAADGPTRSNVGGPLIPLPMAVGEGSPFERQVRRVHASLRDFERLNSLIATVPLRKPHDGALELSSGFGARLDPFLRTWAHHSGIDFRGSTGEPVRSTAPGRVVHASSMGGYGLMVEIDHGHGLSTRYAHLSRIEVAVGDSVRAGQRVGRVGSTGRSTGPHLHYETRINGEAVDPMRFVRAGLRLAAAD